MGAHARCRHDDTAVASRGSRNNGAHVRRRHGWPPNEKPECITANQTRSKRDGIYGAADRALHRKGRRFQGPVPAEFNISVERRSHEFWIVRNLASWNWSGCEAVVAEKTARIDSFPVGGTVTFTAGDFGPGTPRADLARSASDLTFSCVVDGARVDAVQKTTP